MKRLLAGGFCLCLLLSGCVRSDHTHTEAPTELRLELHPVTNTVTDGNGNEILTLTCPEPELFHSDEAIGEKIMDDLQSRIDVYRADGASLEETARNAAQDQESFIPWFANLEGNVTRQDETVLSIFFSYTVYSGGTHPNTGTFSVTYDSNSGEILQLSDILKDNRSVKELAAEVNRALAHSADELFDDYEALVGEQFAGGNADNWYLTDTALCFHYAPYAIGPYASGTITAEIPFTALGDMLLLTYTN